MQAAVSHEAHQSRRAAILAAAETVFAEAGFDRARLEDVALRVGIRRASLLYHFHDKSSLYASVTASMGEDLARRFRRALDGAGSPGTRIERTVDEWLDYAAARPALVRIMLRELADGASEHARAFAEQALGVMNAVRDVVQEGQATGTLRPTDALQVFSAVLGASTFLLRFGAVLGDGTGDRAPMRVNRAEHRAFLITMFRTFLGTRETDSNATDR